MPIIVRSVNRSKNVLRFSERVNDRALRDFVPALYDAINRGHRDLVLDFRRTTFAYADAVLPIVCLVDHRRARGNEFRVELPDDSTLRRLFLNSNWANLIDPSHPRVDLRHPEHLPASRYTSHTEQQEAVDSVLRIVLRSMDLRRDVIAALEWSLNEITDNVLNHAQSPSGGIVQVNTFHQRHAIKFVVADAGRGIPVAMREAFPHLRNDADAINEAVKAGVTSVPESGQGNGLAGSLRIATRSQGSFKISAGRAQVSVFKDERTGKYRTQNSRAPSEHRFPGTVVMLDLRTDTDFAIEEALALEGRALVGVSDIVDLRYISETGDLVVKLCEESLGFGTRHAGVELRRKCRNLLNAEPGRRLVLDWSGVPLVASSFADEAVGKLFVEMGPTEYATRVSHLNTEPLVRSLLDRAILQRVAQSVAQMEQGRP